MAKILFTCPPKALANEKMEAWGQLFHDKTILQLTGDTLTNQKVRMDMMEKAKDADILVMTAELLDSITRNFWSEKYQWVKDVQLLTVTKHMASPWPVVDMSLKYPSCAFARLPHKPRFGSVRHHAQL